MDSIIVSAYVTMAIAGPARRCAGNLVNFGASFRDPFLVSANAM